jgi:hypothetical protein
LGGDDASVCPDQKVSQGDRPLLPESMNVAIQHIIKGGWSMDRTTRASFDDILEALWWI